MATSLLCVTAAMGVVPLADASTSAGPRAIFEPLTPARILDTRDGTGTNGLVAPLGNAPFTLTVRGFGGVPADATAVVMNLTVTGGTAGSWMFAWPADVTMPNASVINWSPQQTVANMVTVTLSSATGQIKLLNALGTVHVIADVAGYYHGHDHDDRYYSKAQSDANYYSKAQSDANYYSKAQSDANYYTKAAIDANLYTKAQVDAKFATSGRMNVSGAAFQTTGNAVRATTSAACMYNSTNTGSMVAALQLPVGVTITHLVGFLYDDDASAGTLQLWRTTATSQSVAQITSTGNSGANNFLTALATPEVVDAYDYFYLEYSSPTATNHQQICGAGVVYSIPSGSSVLSPAQAPAEPSGGTPAGVPAGR